MSGAPSRRTAILSLDLVVLEQLLCLPAGCEIEAIEHNIARPGSLLLRVHGAGFEVAPGQLIPMASNGTVHEVDVDIDSKPRRAFCVTWGPDLCPDAS